MKPTSSLLVLFFLLLAALPSPAQNSTHNFEVAKNLDIFNALYRELDLYYVDTLDAKKNIDNALAYMLEMLDPYTEYYPEEDASSLQELTTGKYAGIGTMIGYSEAHRRCIVSKPYAGMPAAQAGLLPGDIILAIDGEDIQPLENPTEERIADYTEQVSGKLRGEAGITLELKIRRPEQNKVFTFKLVRRNILMPSVSLAAMVTDSIGYICLTQFIEGTSNEIRRALVELKQQGARSLILDLRDNPGGVMEEAVKTVNLFIPRGREVVSTRGKVKELNAVYKTQIDPQDPDIPLIILTNENSASAAEITSGALQDYDRALIMGRRTYGKGLVQQSRELPYKALLKLTTAKYYIPSGRCVQAYEFRDGVPLHLPDSLSREFRTAAGRPVRGGGGVKPDVEIPAQPPHLPRQQHAALRLLRALPCPPPPHRETHRVQTHGRGIRRLLPLHETKQLQLRPPEPPPPGDAAPHGSLRGLRHRGTGRTRRPREEAPAQCRLRLPALGTRNPPHG